MKTESSSAKLCVNFTSMVVGGETLKGKTLRKFIEGMSEEDRRTMLEDIGILKALNRPNSPCSHCGGNGYEP